MAAPVTNSEFEALIIEPDDSLATAIVKVFVKLPVLVYKIMRYFFNLDGTISPEFEADICAAKAECTTEVD